MKKSFIKVSLCTALLAALVFPARLGEAAPPRISTNAAGSALIDVESGRILHSEKGDVPMRIASLTKIMTAIVAIENAKLSDTVKVSKNAFGKEGSSLYLKLGEEMNLHHMLYGLMLRSGNDAATAIAEHVGGSEEGFVYMMNQKAAELGMVHSHFMNPSGLDAEGHYASANDMAKLTAYALKNPIFHEIVATKMKKVPNPNENWDYTWFNKNKLLSMFEGADGVKTGYTKLAKRTLVTSATRGVQQVAAVTLSDSNDWADHARLLQYGFTTYPLQRIVEKGEPVEQTALVAGRTVSYPLAEGELAQITKRVSLTGPESTGYRLGERGTLEVLLDGNAIAVVPLYELNSPRLQDKEQSAFSFKESAAYRETFTSRYLLICRALIQKLFSFSPSEWKD